MNKMILQLDAQCDAVLVLHAIVQVLGKRAELNLLQRNRICLAVDEVYANIVRHGYQRAGGVVHLEADMTRDAQGLMLQFIFRDEAPPVDMSGCDCGSEIAPCSAEALEPGGLGIPFIHAIMDEVQHTMLEHGNQWNLIYRCTQEGISI